MIWKEQRMMWLQCRLSLKKVKDVVDEQLSKNNNEISRLKQKVDKINEQLDHHPANWNEIVKNVSESLEAVNDNI